MNVYLSKIFSDNLDFKVDNALSNKVATSLIEYLRFKDIYSIQANEILPNFDTALEEILKTVFENINKNKLEFN